MGTPIQEFSWLKLFPLDIWAYITCYLSGEHLGRLKMTGSMSLWNKLKATKSVKLERDSLQFEVWPSFLKDLRSIEELSVRTNTMIQWPVSGIKLDSMPATLRKLQIQGRIDDFSNFFVAQGGGTLNLDEYIPHLEVLYLNQASVPGNSWMAHSPKSLTKLSIPSWNGSVALPPTVIRLKTYKMYFSDGVKLPPQLETLVVEEMVGLDLLVHCLPPTLLKLHIFQVPSATESTSIAHLPRTMTSLIIPYCHLPDHPVSSLPCTLTKFGLSTGIPPSKWSSLPPNIKHLSLVISWPPSPVASNSTPKANDNHEIPVIPFETLPQSVRHLTVMNVSLPNAIFCGPPSNTALPPYFPTHLTYLNIARFHLSPGAAKQLPSSLTHLQVSGICEKICELLPTGLLQLMAYHTLVSQNLFKFLPKSLTYLYLTCAADYDPWFNYSTGETIDSISKLPEYNTHENYGGNIDWSKIRLPPNLTQLNLVEFVDLTDSFIMEQRLPNLLFFNLRETVYFTDLSIPYLSRHLSTLDLASSSDISGKCFKLLPRSLIWLNLNASVSIFDSDIQHLPRTLQQLHLDDAVELTDSCVLDLPPNLEKLSVASNKNISPSSFPNMPYRLHSRHPPHYYSVTAANWAVFRGTVKSTSRV